MLLGAGGGPAGGAGATENTHDERKIPSRVAADADAVDAAGVSAEPQRRAADGLPESIAGLPPSAGIISSGETLHVRITPPGADAAAAAREQKLKVNEDGMIQLPDAAPVRAMGLTPAELEQQLALVLRDKSTVDHPVVSVRREEAIAPVHPATSPSDADADGVTDVLIVVRQQALAATEVAGGDPTTRPAIPATQPGSPLFRAPPPPPPTTTRSSD
jgi:hypothetical protein